MRITTKLTGALLALAIGVTLSACGSDSDNNEVTGKFEPVPGAPKNYADLSGEATLKRSDDGTEASIRLSGLRADTEYVAHVHAGGCDQADPGGPHYKFDADGSDGPPNEIHFAFISSAEGDGEAEASNSNRIPDGDAGSVVVHAADGEAMGHGISGDGGAMSGDEHGEAMEHENEGHSHSDKIGCANLEGDAGAADGGAARSTGDAMEHDGEAMEHKGEDAASGPTIAIRNGKPVGGVRELEYTSGEQIAFRVHSDVTDEVHVHGYDLSKRVKAGRMVSFSFTADLQGIFEVELEERGEQIAELRVNP